ncbi:MAG: NAD(+) salvage pathway protein [Chaenotheca gracillima]|nr:MAG: NAD(+) salvage pathway protein [Chaenotheca gracillima]
MATQQGDHQAGDQKHFRPALIVVDMQEDFCPPNGSLAVTDGRTIAPTINALLTLPFVLKVGTKDWHPPDHISFASNHAYAEPHESSAQIENPADSSETVDIMLWPDHCVQGTDGAELIPELDTQLLNAVVLKGTDRRVEMYSAFADVFGNKADPGPGSSTRQGEVEGSLEVLLARANVSHVYVVGLAADYCVLYTALDSAKAGFKTFVVEEATRAVDSGEESLGRARKKWSDAGVDVISMKGKEVDWIRMLEGGA